MLSVAASTASQLLRSALRAGMERRVGTPQKAARLALSRFLRARVSCVFL